MVESANVDKQFAAAQAFIQKEDKNAPKLSNNDKLKFYSLFKQATIGACNIKQPSRMNLVARAKYDAWKAHGSMSQLDAKKTFLAEFFKMAPNAKL